MISDGLTHLSLGALFPHLKACTGTPQVAHEPGVMGEWLTANRARIDCPQCRGLACT
jgi:hypothetical protein